MKERISWAACGLAFLMANLIGIAWGFWCGDYMSRAAVDQIDRRQAIEDACMAGNANACTIFTVKHGR